MVRNGKRVAGFLGGEVALAVVGGQLLFQTRIGDPRLAEMSHVGTDRGRQLPVQHVDCGRMVAANAQVHGYKPAAYRTESDVLRETLLRHCGAGAGGPQD